MFNPNYYTMSKPWLRTYYLAFTAILTFGFVQPLMASVEIHLSKLTDGYHSESTLFENSSKCLVSAPDLLNAPVVYAGCTDPVAVNYDPNATTDDGSCLYPIISCGPDSYSYCYGNNEFKRFYYEADSGSDLYILLEGGEVQGGGDFFFIWDNFDGIGNPLYTVSGALDAGEILHSTTGRLMVQVVSGPSISCTDQGYDPLAYTVRCEAPAANGDCANSIQIQSALYPQESNQVGNLWFVENSGNAVCAGQSGADLYYSFTLTERNTYILNVNPIGGADVVIQLLDACGGTELDCANVNGSGVEESLLLSSLDPGSYIVRVHNESGNVETQTTGLFTINLQQFPFAGVQNNPNNFLFACNQSGMHLEDFIGADPQTGSNIPILDYKWLVAEESGGFLNEYRRYQPNYSARLSWLGMVPGKTYNVFVSALINHPIFGPLWTVYGGDFNNPHDIGASSCTVSTSANVTATELLTTYASTMGELYGLCDVIVAQNVEGSENFRWRFDPNINNAGDELIYTRGSGNPGVRLSWVPGIEPGVIYTVDVQVQVDGNWSAYGAQKPLELAAVPQNIAVRSQYCGGTYGPNSVILSESVCEADYYRFRLTPLLGGPASYRTSGNYALILNGELANLAPGDYNVEVKVSQGGHPGDFGPDCQITIGGPTAPGTEGAVAQRIVDEQGSVTLYPNPSTGEEVRVTLNGLPAGNHDVMITVLDLYGKQLNTQGFGHEGDTLNRILRFDEGLPTGVYVIQVIVDDQVYSAERLVVH